MEETPFGRYRLRDLLGRGGMGEVWRAYDTATNRIVALKVLLPHSADDEDFQRRFRREAEIAAGLNDPHVVPIHDYGEIDGRLFVNMRLIDGRDLGEVLRSGGPLPPARAVHLIEQVAEALEAAHAVGLVHRDIKPSNVLVTPRDFVYLIDFGIARASGQTRFTSTGMAVGTFAYMAPERFESHECEPNSDIYALTCVLYECLTGQLTFPGDSLPQQIAAHLNKPPPAPSAIAPGIPAALDAVIAKGMAKLPSERFQTSVELADAARAALGAPTQPAAPKASPPQLPRVEHHTLPPRLEHPPTVPRPVSAASPDAGYRPPPAFGPSHTEVAQQSPAKHVVPQRRRPWWRRKRVIAVVGLVLLLIIGLEVGLLVVRSNYYAVAQGDSVYIMRGVQGSFLGMELHEPFAVVCLNGTDELMTVSIDTVCRQLKVDDLTQAGSAQLKAGLPGGSLTEATQMLKQLVKTSWGTVCMIPPPIASPGCPAA